MDQQLFVSTPLVESLPLSQLLGVPVYLKLENVQPSGSFKIRGISSLCHQAVSKGFTTLVSASAGNAGLSMTYCARHLGVKAKVVVSSNTPALTIQQLQDEGAQVEVYGRVWNDANDRALALAQETPGAAYIDTASSPALCEGYGQIVDEMASALGPAVTPSCVVVSVGDGGLACGVLGALPRVGWGSVPLLAVETLGADCFNQSVKSGKKVTLPGITSVAVCLGSVVPCDALMDFLLSGKRPIVSEVVTDREAVHACLKFADDHRYLVEPACGAALAAIYAGHLSRLFGDKTLVSGGPVILVVCGGCGVSLSQLAEWKKQFKL